MVIKDFCVSKVHLRWKMNIFSSPGALLQVSLCSGLLSVIRPSLAFHIFDISSRTISWIKLKLSRRHCGNMEIQIAKIVQFRYPRWPSRPSWNSSNYLSSQPQVQLSWNLMASITVTQRFKIAKIVPFWYPRRWPSWNSSNDTSSQTLSPIELKLDGRHQSDTQIQNC